jgi:hypothetical protein
MTHKKEKVIGLLETGITFLLIYINWVGYYHMQQVGTDLNFDVFMGALDFLLIFLLYLSASRLYYPNINPIITLFLLFFKQISFRTV